MLAEYIYIFITISFIVLHSDRQSQFNLFLFCGFYCLSICFVATLGEVVYVSPQYFHVQTAEA